MSLLTRIKDTIIDIIAVICLWFVLRWDDIWDTIKSCLITLVVCLVLFGFFIKPATVSGGSMYPTIKDKSFGFSSIIKKKIVGIDRFDIVTIRVGNRKLIKRVIGLPGDSIVFKDEQLYINDQLVDQDFIDPEYFDQQYQENGYFTKDFTVIVGEDEYFCMGDNRIVSADSRYYGAFKYDQILSTGLFVLYPFTEFGIVR